MAGRAAAIAHALGGLHNLRHDDCAPTRLRIVVDDPDRIDEIALQTAGLPALMRISPDLVHVIVGPDAAALADGLRELMAAQAGAARCN